MRFIAELGLQRAAEQLGGLWSPMTVEAQPTQLTVRVRATMLNLSTTSIRSRQPVEKGRDTLQGQEVAHIRRLPQHRASGLLDLSALNLQPWGTGCFSNMRKGKASSYPVAIEAHAD